MNSYTCILFVIFISTASCSVYECVISGTRNSSVLVESKTFDGRTHVCLPYGSETLDIPFGKLLFNCIKLETSPGGTCGGLKCEYTIPKSTMETQYTCVSNSRKYLCDPECIE